MKAQAKLISISQESPNLKDKDGSDGQNGICDIHISVCLNGFMVSISYDDGTELRETFDDFDEVLGSIRSQF